MDLRSVITAVFLLAGCFFIITAAIGTVRFPDFYSRIHPAGKSDTLGQAMILTGLMIYEGFSLVSLKLLFIIIFILVVNPTTTHALANAAYTRGLKPWRKEALDKNENKVKND